MKTTAIVLAILLLGSMTLNYWLWKENDEQQHFVECFATRGFEPQKTIPVHLSDQFYREYRGSLTLPDSTFGGIITRSAFDEMLCTPGCNAISYTFAKDSTGTTGPGGNGVFVIFSGLNVTYVEASNTYTYRDLKVDRYIPGRWCPPTCNPF